MKKTRNLFLLVGSPEDTMTALEAIQFKGLITNSYWHPLLLEFVQKVFDCNKSVVGSRDDFVGKIPEDAIVINVVPTARSHVCSSRQTIYLRDSETIANQFEKIADSLGLDIGDHKSNSSGLTDGPTKKDCAYCQYLDGNIQKMSAQSTAVRISLLSRPLVSLSLATCLSFLTSTLCPMANFLKSTLRNFRSS